MNLFKVVFIVVLQAAASMASAHVGLKSSVPENGATVMASPEVLQLEFNSSVRLVKLKVTGPQGEKVDIAFKPSAAAAKDFSVQLPEVDSGSYTINWMAIGGDAHKVKGNFSFIVHENY